jgi:lysophospholipase L1-like esterase
MKAVRAGDIIPAYVLAHFQEVRKPKSFKLAVLVCSVAALMMVSLVLGMWCQQQNLWPKRYFIKAQTVLAGKDLTPQTVYKSKYDIWEDLPVTQPVVMVGDSLTEFGDWAELLGFNAIANRGVAKDTTEGLLNRLDRSAGSDGTVFLMIGINDLSQGMKSEAIIGRYSEIVARLNERGNKVYAQSILFTQDVDLNRRIAHANASIQQLCAKARDCTYLDINRAIAPEGVLPTDKTIDGIHVNAQGYRLWAGAIRSRLPGKKAD